MKCVYLLSALLIAATTAFAQQPSTNQPPAGNSDDSSRITIRGCLRTQRQTYVLTENRTGAVYALQGVGNKLHKYLRKEIEVTGETKPGSRRTGVRPEKAGSNPSDTLHGVDGIPLEVHDISKDMRVTADQCKAADAP